ncbi:FAD-binding oxidoreductase [Dokdonella fugitiva]|jgi:ferredoxin-NADP reductase|uniref:Ferredoxin-NADP reductase n=1 Tax=Dokdonella fugitiva TaxID=328517 RepID=A0A4R2IHM6_9GAMM|nr:FAD-binding oxidoreductase [Dokdonella fugitiva]MBA8882766.1 ferredoxin-NADP reductase [Dokdonella fugitiva]TCO43258.1 ferredoxin-NADP reductase [Dokdonella fugitiva]
MEHFKLRLAASHMLAPTVRHLAFEREDGAPFAFVPGQFLQIHFHYADGKPTKRSYSVATVGDGKGPVQRIEIAVSYVEGGAATELLSTLDEGGTIEASGPYGRFCLMDGDTNARYLLVATGTGVTPYRAMLPQIRTLTQSRGCTFALVYGARNEGELLYGEEFEAFAREVPGFTFHPCLSRTPRAVPRPHDRHGRAQVALGELGPNAATDIAYLCGNPNMVDEAFAMLKEAGLPVPHIRREKYVSSR